MSETNVFEKILANIPLTWKCCKCGVEHINAPDYPAPWGVQVEDIFDRDHNFQGRKVVGDICKQCMEPNSQ